MYTSINQPIRFGDPLITLKDSYLLDRKIHPDDILISRKLPSKGASVIDYLYFIEQNVPKDLISNQNFSEIKNLANILSGELTSFLIFESRLGNSEARSDYSFAVSSMNGERENLLDLIKNKNLLKTFHDKYEWQKIENFTTIWADSNSELNKKILGIWFEFDTSNSYSKTIVPNIFIQPLPIFASSINLNSRNNWLIDTAIPILNGKQLSKRAKKQIITCIQMLPENSSIFQIGTMLSRKTKSIRLVIKRIERSQIIPYLTSIGWSDKKGELSSLLKELDKYITRIVLHIGVGEHIDPDIGIECSFYKDQFHKEEKWSNFLNYLRNKGICLPKKQSALINFMGMGKIDSNYEFDSENCIPSVMVSEKGISTALIRYISHIKIIYRYDRPLEAKAYAAVRHFGCPYKSITQATQLVMKK